MFCKTLTNQVVLILPPDSWKRPVSVTPRILPSFWCIRCDHQGLNFWDPSSFHWPLRCRRCRPHPPMLRLGAASCLACSSRPPAQLQREPCSSLSLPNFPNAFWEVLDSKLCLVSILPQILLGTNTMVDTQQILTLTLHITGPGPDFDQRAVISLSSLRCLTADAEAHPDVVEVSSMISDVMMKYVDNLCHLSWPWRSWKESGGPHRVFYGS